MSTDPGIEAAYREAVERARVRVTVIRPNGFAPNVDPVLAENIPAAIRDATPDTTEPAQSGLPTTRPGAMTEADRIVILMTRDLERARFPLPLKKNDRIQIVSIDGRPVTDGDVFNIVAADPYKRAAGGAIECKAASVH